MILKPGLCLFSESGRLMNRPSEGKKRRRRRRSGRSVESRDEDAVYSGGESGSESESEDDGKKK